MVATASVASVQTNDSEKRRKQTLERAKANHLSRQLQMRLQYARLKVDHGWQKQNLNEVENLYFHHSHLRGPRPYPSSSILTTTTTQKDPTFPTPSSNSNQSSLSYKFSSSSLSRNSTVVTLTGVSEGDMGYNRTTPASSLNIRASPPSLTLTSNSETSSSSSGRPNHSYSGLNTLISMDVEQDEKFPPASATFGNLPLPPNQSFPDQNQMLAADTKNNMLLHMPRSPAPAPTITWLPVSSGSSNHFLNVAQSTSQNHTPTPSSAPDTYGFASSTTLTYDSFWSSHSVSTGSRSFRGSFGTEPPASSSGSGDGIQQANTSISSKNVNDGGGNARVKRRSGGSASAVGVINVSHATARREG